MKRLARGFFLKWNFLYVPMRYRTQLHTFLYWDSFAPTCSSGEKSIWTLLLSPMSMTAPIYSAMEQPSEWVYYFLTTQRKMLWREKIYPTSSSTQVHLQMSSRSCKIYNWNSTKDSTIPVLYQVSFQNNTRNSSIQVPHLVPYRNSTKDHTIPVLYQVPHLNSTKDSTVPVLCTSTRENPASWYSTQHSWLLLSGPPHPPQLWLEEQQQNRSIQYTYIQKLHVRHF